ncbi:hypothetical protein H4Q26_016174 [Puccinia striiformis f. sp. tritici PST-130]|nr:hypothetical protein H4Q26_016174 [Puccinia striiformis f. sp. tritici PST-130]
MELSTTEEFACKTDPNWTSTVDITTEETLDLITSAIYCTNGSELDAAEDRWKSPVQAGMNGVLERAMCVSKKYPSAMCTTEWFPLSRRGINRKRLPFFTAMNSKQIKSLCDSASPILNDLLRLLDILLRADRVTGGHTISVRDINQIAETIHRHFETPMLLAMLYIVPLIEKRAANFPTCRWQCRFMREIIRAEAEFICESLKNQKNCASIELWSFDDFVRSSSKSDGRAKQPPQAELAPQEVRDQAAPESQLKLVLRDQKELEDDLEEIDSMLWGIETVAKPGTYVGYEGQRPIRKLAREPVIKLAYMAIGIIKLAKLFFKKLSRRGMATKRFPVVTTMCSEQISILAQLVGQVARDIMKLLALLTQAEANDPAATSHEFIQVAKDIKSRFDLPLLVVANHLIPAIPDTDRLQDRDYFKNWFMSWDTELTCATEKLIQVATLLDDDPA